MIDIEYVCDEDVSVEPDDAEYVPEDSSLCYEFDQIARLENKIDELTDAIKSLQDAIVPILYKEAVGAPVVPVTEEEKTSKWTPILKLLGEGLISVKVANALDFAGVRYVADFKFVSLPDLMQFRGLNEESISNLLSVLESRFNICIGTKKESYPILHIGDIVEYLVSSSTYPESGQSLKLVEVDNSSFLPKYRCCVVGDRSRSFVLSPSTVRRLSR